ncbi:MAG TPA: DUF5131 family protein, partial [Myxococcaceae bacterium]|nr:DUF5131 family protein [Myxococcaceae bacterium]
MADRSSIEWTDATWNPLAAFDRATGKRGWFCTKVSDGCTHCYAETLNKRLGTGHLYRVGNLPLIEFRLVNLDQTIRWQRPRKIFVNSMTDLFHEAVPFDLIDQVFGAMALAHQHVHQVLTKRPERMAEYFADEYRWAYIEGAAQKIHHDRTGEDPSMWLAVHGPLPNVWLGTSVEDQAAADERIPHLLRTPAAVRFLS